MEIGLANDTMLGYWGKYKSALNRLREEAVTELQEQAFLNILKNIYKTGEVYEAKSSAAELVIDGKLATRYFDFTDIPLFDRQQKIYGIVDVAVDVTEEVIKRRQPVISESCFRNVFEQACLAIGLLTGPDIGETAGIEQYEGTSIGLAISGRVAANHGGAILARSQPGRGSTFSIYFPA